jgi:hypothetical protein
MKRINVFLFLLIGLMVAKPASAVFEAGHLIGVIYNPSEIEIGIDLGPIEDIATKPSGSLLATNAFSLPSGTEAAWLAGFFALDGDDYYFATTNTTAPAFNPRSFASFVTGDALIRPYYVQGGNDPNHQSSYNYKMNANKTVPGQYASLNYDWESGEANLANLATVGYVDMYLYAVHKISRSAGEAIPGIGNDYQAILRIHVDGSVELNPPMKNEAPTINSATVSPNPVFEGDSVTLTGSATDPDGDVLT